MTAKTKWIVYSALVLIAVLLIAIFSRNIVNAMQNLLVKILIYLIVFAAGWLTGYFTGRNKRRQSPSQPAQ